MNAPLILLHEDALRLTHPVFEAAPPATKAIYVWDDAYFRKANYSLKRLIFIYETLCELPIDIICGTTLDIVQTFAPSTLYVPKTHNPLIAAIIHELNAATQLKVIDDESFAIIKNMADCRRFFQYWNKAEKSVFQRNAGADA